MGRALPARAARYRTVTFLAAILPLCAGPTFGQAYTARGTTAGDIRLYVTNHGVLGNNFVFRTPSSFEYPAGTGYEHLTHAGLWLGARTADANGAFTGVVTGGKDQFPGNATASLTEFSPLDVEINVRSSDPSSPRYSPLALSDEEMVTLFDDHVPKAGSPEPHRPMSVTVRQITHGWNQPGYRDIVIVRYIVTSHASAPLGDLWVGLYSELASGPKNNYSTWPPSGSWFHKKLIEWDPAWRMLREHYCANLPVPAGCNFQVVPPWVGVQLLTAPAPGRQVTLAAWSFAPGDPSRDEDTERYALMSAGTIADLSAAELQPRDGDPTELLATGPFQLEASGDSIEVAFALVGGADVPSLQQHARTAQTLADHGYDLSVVGVTPASAVERIRIAPVANPSASGDLEFLISLPRAEEVSVVLFDPFGRRIASQSFAGLSVGTHRVRLGAGRLAPGVYQVRVTDARGSASTRVVQLRR
jgi:hypothetical protein